MRIFLAGLLLTATNAKLLPPAALIQPLQQRTPNAGPKLQPAEGRRRFAGAPPVVAMQEALDCTCREGRTCL